ncbi:MAG: helix-turn-helix domain-containing protein [Planctomycetota bacterium]
MTKKPARAALPPIHTPAPPPDKLPAKPVLLPRPLTQATSHGDLAIVAVGHQPQKTAWIDHRFQMHAVGLVVSGRGTYTLSAAPVESAEPLLPPAEPPAASTALPAPALQAIEPGTMFTVFPGPVFTYGPTPGPAWEEFYFCALGAGVRRWIDFGWFPDDGAVYRLATLGPALDAFRELMRIQRRGAPGDADRAVPLAERLLIEMFHARETRGRPSETDHTLAAVLAFCRQNLNAPVDFKAVARDHAMSYSSLRQRFKQVTGLPPAQYLNHLRCERARELLSDTDLTVKQIGAAVGLPDPYSFSRRFKACVGLAPDRYRRQAAPWAAVRAAAAGTQSGPKTGAVEQ